MEKWLLIAVLQFADGTEGPTIPVETFDSYDACDYRAQRGWDIAERVNAEWITYMNQTGDIRPLRNIGLTCIEKIDSI